MGQVKPGFGTCLMCCGGDAFHVKQLPTVVLYAGKKYQRQLVGLQLNEEYSPDRVMVVGNPVREEDATVLYESGWVINRALEDDPAKLEAACRFVENLTGTEFQSSKVETGLEISANAEAADAAPEESTYPEITQVFVEEVADGRLPYGAIYANWPLIEEAINLMMENILAGGDVEEEVAIAVEEIERELERANRE